MTERDLYVRQMTEKQKKAEDEFRTEIKRLKSENDRLHNINEEMANAFDVCIEKLQLLQSEYSNWILELCEAKNAYDAARADLFKLRKKYEKEMSEIIKRFCRMAGE